MEIDSAADAVNGASGPQDDFAAQLAAANTRAEDNHQKFLYAMADFENYKRRVERQRGELALADKKALIAKFLPVLDNLDRALNFEQDTEGLRKGLNATFKGFEAVLGSEGVKAMKLKGEKFDPRLAEAIGTQKAADTAEDTILEEAQRGYMLGDDVLRVAQVIVAKND